MTLLNAVERLGELQLLAERTGQYDFDHNKIREVVYHDLSAARRGLYHRQIADTLEAVSLSPEKASLLAHHLERGGEKEKALTYWLHAGRHALDTYHLCLPAGGAPLRASTGPGRPAGSTNGCLSWFGARLHPA